jgi:hypothetical protein
MIMSPKAAAIALLLASVVNSPVYADDDGGAKPLLEGELETGLSTDGTFSSDDPTAAGDPYTLRLEERDDGFELLILDERERDVDRETGEQILSVLREFAS